MPPTPPVDWTLTGMLLAAIGVLASVVVYLFFLYVGIRNRHESKIEILHAELLPRITAYAAAAERLNQNAEKLLEAALKLQR